MSPKRILLDLNSERKQETLRVLRLLKQLFRKPEKLQVTKLMNLVCK